MPPNSFIFEELFEKNFIYQRVSLPTSSKSNIIELGYLYIVQLAPL